MKKKLDRRQAFEGWSASSQPPPRARLANALPLLKRALAVSELHLRQQCLAFSEVHLAYFLAQFHQEAMRIYSLALEWPDEASVSHLALSAALLRKNLSLERLSQVSRTIYREVRPEDREAFEHLRTLHTHLSMLRLAGPGTLSPDEHQRRIETLCSQSEAIEAALARHSPMMQFIRKQPPLAKLPSRVAAALPRDGALVELVAASSEWPAGPPRYLALLLFADGHTHAIDLGAAALPDAAAILLHRSLTGRSASWQTAAQALYTLVVRPLLSRLGSVRRLFVAPDGWLALTPFTVLHDGERFLSDTFDITQLSSGRDLLATAKGSSPPRPLIFLTSLDVGFQSR